MKTILVFAIPVVLIAGVAFVGTLFGAWLYRLGMQDAVDLLEDSPRREPSTEAGVSATTTRETPQ